MQSLRRTSSSSSCSSDTSASDLTAPPARPIPRKRVSPAQLKALNAMYNAKSHPSREERLALSAEIDMELKAVTIWLQNKRQMMKKTARASIENSPPDGVLIPVGRQSLPPSTLANKPLLRANISLDHIARLSERASGGTRTTPPSPLAPRRINVRDAPQANIDKTDLWQHMPSSPIAAPSSPGEDTARFSVLSSRSRTMRSLEWACAKARVAGKQTEELEADALPTFHLGRPSYGEEANDSYDTETETEEAITPNASMDILPGLQSFDRKESISRAEGGLAGEKGSDIYTSGDVEAAMVLLGFMSRA